MNNLTPDTAAENRVSSEAGDRPGVDSDWNGFELRISDSLFLVHDPSVEVGKTMGMAKGLFLRCKGYLCAGESAGLGLPVWKTRFRTFFPALVCIKKTSGRTIEMIMSLERGLAWEIAGMPIPGFFTQALECLVAVYAKNTRHQKRMLALRDMIISLLSVRSKMVQVPGRGLCRVILKADPAGLLVRVDGSALRGRGRLIVLNEFEGRIFTRLTDRGQAWEGADVPGWRLAGSGVCLESPSLGIEVTISQEGEKTIRSGELFCGREVANSLNWAGIAVMAPAGRIAYHVGIRERKSFSENFR